MWFVLYVNDEQIQMKLMRIAIDLFLTWSNEQELFQGNNSYQIHSIANNLFLIYWNPLLK